MEPLRHMCQKSSPGGPLFAEFSSNQLQNTCLEVPSNPKDLLVQVYLIRAGAKLQ